MFGIKTKIIKRLEKHLLNINNNNFKSISFIEKKIMIILIKKGLKKESAFINIQNPNSRYSNPLSAIIIRATAQFMPNNLGNWSINKPFTLSGIIELNLIELIKKYFNCNKNIIGHCSSGTTEGNIYATWIGRKFLQNKNKKKIALIKSSLAHYSIDKAADIVGIKLFETSINEKELNLDIEELEKTIDKLYLKNYRGFLIPITLGYTVTGTEDDYQKICKLIKKIKIKYKDCELFLWIDAAFSGFNKIINEKKFKPFLFSEIKLISLDFHKILGVPYPASVLLYRKKILKFISKNIPYINQQDTTLLGSRPGLSPIAIWFTLVNLKKSKISKVKKNCEEKKRNFLQQIRKEKLNVRIINNNNSFQACLITKDKFTEKKLYNNYQLKAVDYNLLINNKVEKFKVYKIYFLPEF